ncbi:MAG: RHS repeat-associated core domain-containing protein [Chitinophagales bacterium]|nr:RHS repeat-associated core domain-containing protein [Chitinophagales bacterium]
MYDPAYLQLPKSPEEHVHAFAGGAYRGVFRQKLSGGSAEAIQLDACGDLRRGKDKNLYIAARGAALITSYKTDIFGMISSDMQKQISIAPAMSGVLPHQVHKVFRKTPAQEEYVYRVVGRKSYELKDHLGNVTVVVSDAKEAATTGSVITGYHAYTESYTHYYPFGMAMPGRSYNSGEYRFGYNGKEKDSEGMGGGGSTYDYGFRIYNPALGRFLSVDPLARVFPMLSPYQFAGNTPIQADDLDGLEVRKRTILNSDGTTLIKIMIKIKLINKSSCKNVDYKRLNQDIVNQIKKSYTLNDNNTKIKYEVESVNIVVVGENNLNRKKDFFVELKDPFKLDIEGIIHKGLKGYADKLGDTEQNRIQTEFGNTSLRMVALNIAHELGHTMGLKHVVTPEKQDKDIKTGENLYDHEVNTGDSPRNLMKQYIGMEDDEILPVQMKRATQVMREEKQ